jgi:hypothetical protein
VFARRLRVAAIDHRDDGSVVPKPDGATTPTLKPAGSVAVETERVH